MGKKMGTISNATAPVKELGTQAGDWAMRHFCNVVGEHGKINNNLGF